MTCNTELQPKSKAEVRELVDADTRRSFQEFFCCPSCRKVFWKGSHFERMEQMILDMIQNRTVR